MRQCAGCRERKEQRGMARFVRGADGQWRADPSGAPRKPGRGAYLCSHECVSRVAKNKRYRGLASAAAEYGFK
ncbi:MAG: YlxR family protein [Vulcanimicrobiaceae bacterium]